MVYFHFAIENVCGSKWPFVHLDLFGIISSIFIIFNSFNVKAGIPFDVLCCLFTTVKIRKVRDYLIAVNFINKVLIAAFSCRNKGGLISFTPLWQKELSGRWQSALI